MNSEHHVALTMSFFFPNSLTKFDEVLMKRIFISHDPDHRRIDSEQLLHFIETILISDTSSVSEVQSVSDFELTAAPESLGEIISKASNLMICISDKEPDLAAGVMALFDLLEHFRWDAKMVLVLAAFAMTYGELWLVIQLDHQSQLAASVAELRQISTNSHQQQQSFKAMRSLFSILAHLTRSMIRFCALPDPEDEMISLEIPQVHAAAAAYWVIRATLICSTRILHLVSTKSEPAGGSTVAMWELTSLASRLRDISNALKLQFETCHRQKEGKLRLRLKNLQTEACPDNQEVLRTLLGMQDDFPLKDSAPRAKPKSLSELKNKVVLILVSTTDLLQVETFILLSQKLCQHHHKFNGRFELVWVPMSESSSWSEADKKGFELLSNSMPWRFIRRPWLLHRAAVEHIKQAWEFRGHPIMPVLDTQGAVLCSNALDMVLVWGAEAFPFSCSREFELWEAADWTLEFLLNELDPLVSTWMEEGRNLWIFGGNDAEWISKVSAELSNMIKAGLQVKVAYVGARHLSQIVANILRPSDRKLALSGSLPVARLEFFWPRLESLRRSKLRAPGANTNDDVIIHHLEKLLDLKCGEDGWAVMGMPKDTIKIFQGEEVSECFTAASFRASSGLPGAVESATETPSWPGPCSHFKAVSYSDDLVGRTVICNNCNRPMEIFFVEK